MKPITLLLACVLSTNLFAQGISKIEIQEDYRFLINALDEGHPGLSWFESKDTYENVLGNVSNNLENVTDISAMYLLLNEIIKTISCGHTTLLLPATHYQMVDSINRYIPFNIKLIENGVIVSESFTSNLSRGDHILSINGEPMEKVIHELSGNIPIDKGIRTKRTRSIEIVFPYYYAIFKGTPESFSVEYAKRESSDIMNAEIDPIGLNKKIYKSVRDYVQEQNPLAWSVDEGSNLGILKLATFSAQQFNYHQIDFKDSVQAIFEKLNNDNISNLIIDLRWNNGGTMPLAEYLFSFFIDSPYIYYKDAKIKKEVMEGSTKYAKSRNMLPMLEKQYGPLESLNSLYELTGNTRPVLPSAPRFKGNLYLLTNGLSFSATSSFIAHIQENKLGLVIGETPGGAYNGINAGPQLSVELPNSKLRLYYRAICSNYNVDPSKDWTEVDIKAENTIDSFLSNKDIQMEYVLHKMIKKE